VAGGGCRFCRGRDPVSARTSNARCFRERPPAHHRPS